MYQCQKAAFVLIYMQFQMFQIFAGQQWNFNETFSTSRDTIKLVRIAETGNGRKARLLLLTVFGAFPFISLPHDSWYMAPKRRGRKKSFDCISNSLSPFHCSRPIGYALLQRAVLRHRPFILQDNRHGPALGNTSGDRFTGVTVVQLSDTISLPAKAMPWVVSTIEPNRARTMCG